MFFETEVALEHSFPSQAHPPLPMFGTRHNDALSTFEDNDPFAGLQANLSDFQRKERVKSKQTKEIFDWIKENRRLKSTEEAFVEQISQITNNVIVDVRRVILFGKCRDNDVVISSIVQSLQADLVTLQTKPITSFQGQDITSLVAAIRERIQDLTNQHDSNDRIEKCAQLLIEMKEKLSCVKEELDKRCTRASLEAKKSRLALSKVSDDDERSKTDALPDKLTHALTSLRTAKLRQLDTIDANGEIDVLEHCLTKEFLDARTKYDDVLVELSQNEYNDESNWDEKSDAIFKSTLSISKTNSDRSVQLLKRLRKALPQKSEEEITTYLKCHETKKKLNRQKQIAIDEYDTKRTELIKQGLKDIASLRVELEKQYSCMKEQVKNSQKNQEFRLRLKLLRKHREEMQQEEVSRQYHEQAKEAYDKHEKETSLLQRQLQTKQAIWKSHSDKMFEKEEERHDVFQQFYKKEVSRITNNRANEERTMHRQDQHNIKLLSQQKAASEATKAEERRLQRLSALAASVPYYRNIVTTSSDIYKTTEARKNDVYAGRGELADFQSGKFKSFTEERVFSDSKFRLGNALHEAGVANTTYARDVIRRMIPRREEHTTGIKPY